MNLKKRKTIVLIGTFAAAACGMALIGILRSELVLSDVRLASAAAIGIGAIGLAVAFACAIFIQWIFWRCQACGKHMPVTQLNIKYCCWCGKELM